MATTASGDFARLIPGFDFLQGLMKNAGAAMPGMGQWIAPTLDPDELTKRIEELRTVQFWLEQNARMLATTIQALEVQRMTLATLKTMNMPVTDVADAFRIRPATRPAKAAGAAARGEASADAASAADGARRSAAPKKADDDASPAAAGLVDPMQWWGALTQQFTQLTSQALRDSAAEAKQLGAMTGAFSAPIAAAADAASTAADAIDKVAPKKTGARKAAATKKAGKAATPAGKAARR